jgi:hypothetical protein
MGIIMAKIPKPLKVFVWPAYLVSQAEPNTSFHPLCECLQHTIRPYRAFHPVPSGTGFSGLLSPCGHSRRFAFALYGLHRSTFLPALAPRALPRFFATMQALTPAYPVLRLALQNERRPLNRQVSLVHTARASTHSATKHLTPPTIASLLPAQRDGLPRPFGFRGTHSRSRGFNQPGVSSRSRSGLHLGSAGSSRRAAESCSHYCYGLRLRLRLLPTSPRGDAVTFGYRERASPGGGLSPPNSRLLPGARTPASAGVTA